MTSAVNKYNELDLPVKTHLLFKFVGTKEQVKHDARCVQICVSTNPSFFAGPSLVLCPAFVTMTSQTSKITSDFGGSGFEWSADEAAKTKLWMARKTALWAANALRPSCVALITDVCVPMSKFPEAISRTKEDIRASGMVAPIVGHAGDGASGTL